MRGLLSADPDENKFANYSKFVLGYCDGALHQGNSKDPVKYKDMEMYFRGSVITRAHFDWINSKYNLKEADKVILTGQASGGIAVNIWSNYLKGYVKNEGRVYPISDSGVYINVQSSLSNPNLLVKVENLYKISNGQEATPISDCNIDKKGE